MTTIKQMHKQVRARRDGRPAFTLLELIVVLLVLGVLAAIAVPTFSTVKENSVERVAQTTLEAIDRNGEAIAVSDPDLSDSQIAELALSEIEAPAGMTITRDGAEITVTNVSGSITAEGTVTFSGGTGTLVPAAVTGGGPSTSTSTSTSSSTSTVALSLSYASGAFSLSGSSQALGPTVYGGTPTSFALTGTLPTGVTFDPATGRFTGPAAWSGSATRIAMNSEHTCAIVNGGARCWGGSNEYGQLGDGTTNSSNTPVAVSGLSSGVVDIATGRYHTCAVTSAGAAKCWGRNYQYQLGDGTWMSRSTPTAVIGLSSGVSRIVAGESHTCALLTSGGVKCWGQNLQGRVGDGTDVDRPIYVDVTGLTSGVASISGGLHHTCAVTDEGAVKCWGSNSLGQLGDGTTTTHRAPVNVSGLSSGVSAVSVGAYHTCALLTSGGVKCWGENFYGEIGDGTNTNRGTPVDVTGLTGVTAVSAGENHTCAVTGGGALKCWGWNPAGQLGDGTSTNRNSPVDAVGLRPGVIGVATTYGATCVVTSSGAAQCWGSNPLGRLGDGTRTTRTAPTDVFGVYGNAGFPATVDVDVTTATGTASTSVTLTLG